MRRSLAFSLLLAAAVTAFAGGRRGFTYVYARGGNSTISVTTHGSLDDVLRLQKRFSGTYVWAVIDGNQVLIRDAAVLAEVARAARPMEALTPDLEALHRKMRPLERRENQLDDELDALSDAHDDDDYEPSDREVERMRVLRSQLREVERELRGYEREEEHLDRRQEALERVFEDELESIVRRAIRTGIAERVR